MGMHCCNGATMMCSFGVAPSTLTVLPLQRLLTSSQPAANIMDHVPFLNVPPFGMCTSLANPTVASATTAALGVLTPMPCIPVLLAPWVVGSPTVIVGTAPALNNTSQLFCAWAGVIQIVNPGQFTEIVP